MPKAENELGSSLEVRGRWGSEGAMKKRGEGERLVSEKRKP